MERNKARRVQRVAHPATAGAAAAPRAGAVREEKFEPPVRPPERAASAASGFTEDVSSAAVSTAAARGAARGASFSTARQTTAGR